VRALVLTGTLILLGSSAAADQQRFSLPGVGPGEAEIVGTLYGTPDLCDSYHHDTSFFDQPVTNDGIWWMDDKRLVGHESYCEIKTKSKAEVEFFCSYEDQSEMQTSELRTGDGWIEIDGQRLDKCVAPSSSASVPTATTETSSNPPPDDLVKAWREAIETCGSEQHASSKAASMDELRAACVKLGVTTTRLMDAGYCLTSGQLKWAYCAPTTPKSSPPSTPAEISLPPNAGGHWTNVIADAEIVFLENKWLQYKGQSDKGPFTENCRIKSQHPTMWRYEVSCPNGISGPLTFYDTGIMEFDFTRFARTPTARSYLLSPQPTLGAPVATIGTPNLGKPPQE